MNNKQFNLLTTLNLNCNDQRWSEFIFCASQNSQNKFIKAIYIAIEIDQDNQEQLRRYNYISSLNEKVFVHTIKNRPTFQELFTFCNSRKPSKWIICNGDIYFPQSNSNTLELLAKKDYDEECFVLTRYNILEEMKEKKNGIDLLYDGLNLRTMHGNNLTEGSSIDSWIFESPFDFSEANFDIQLGQPQCDGMMNYQLSKLRKVTNPCLSIISIHKHLGWYPWYQNVKFNGKSMNNKEYNKLMSEKGHKRKHIKFTRLIENDKS